MIVTILSFAKYAIKDACLMHALAVSSTSPYFERVWPFDRSGPERDNTFFIYNKEFVFDSVLKLSQPFHDTSVKTLLRPSEQ